MNKKEANAWASLIVIAIVSISILVIKVQIGVIHFHQKMFWWSLIFSFIFLLVSLIFLIWGIFQREENNNYYSEPDFFTRDVIFLFAGGLCILALVSFFVVMPNQYNKGYSDEALQRLAELENKLQPLEQLQSILTGQIIWEVQNQVIEETISNLCKDPNYPCESVNQSYQTYKEIKGYKDDAEDIMNYLGFIKKM